MGERGGTRVGSRVAAKVTAFDGDSSSVRSDQLAAEEPLELRLAGKGGKATLAVTMRTPGNDFELAVGFLHGEGLISDRAAVASISYCTEPGVDPEQLFNIVNVELTGPLPEVRGLERNFFTSSACGVCGKAGLDSLSLRGVEELGAGPSLSADLVRQLPERLRKQQALFASTGGLHAAGLFDAAGELLTVREDVGRHNAVDKLIGWALLEGRLPLDDHVVVVSGRASFEIVQKCLAARIPVVCAVSAPSSLAVEVARQFSMTLIGFLRAERFNIYSHPARITAEVPSRA